MNLKKTLLFLLILPLFAFSAHKYYLSMSEITYDEDENALQIITNVFMDDIELAVNKKYDLDLQLTSKYELKSADTYFEKYLNEYLKIKVNTNDVNYKYIGKEYDGNIVYFYLEIENLTKIESISIENKILVNDFKEQQNIIKVTIGDKKKSKILTKKNDKAMLKF